MKRATHFSLHPGWRLLLSDMGLHPEHVLRLAGLPADLFTRQEASISAAQYFGLWQALEQATDVLTLPLKIGMAISVETFDPPIFASFCSPNLNVALQRLATFKKLIGPMTLTVDIAPSGTTATLACYGNDGAIPKSLAMTELVFLTQLTRLGTRQRVVPQAIVLPELPPDPAAYADFFGVMPRQGSAVQIRFASQDGVRPFLTANEAMWAVFEPALRKRLAELDASASMSERVKALLLENLPAGEYGIEAVAKQLAVSRRTLQRQLSEESTSFSHILNGTRQQLAQHYLGRTVIPQGEIAFLLGFQDTNSFIRAFKEWAGMTPGSYRHGVAAGSTRLPDGPTSGATTTA
ncbi:AraC family transcriptional regulator [Vogesella sp. LIG4]|uniref:AraC family transcriptional regulator n=1 Tax=Vogesella sp. LIG4 TaxID=1192162 RepID=UPI0008201CFF|nr:AraC family transcriptional regulator [Vogesella sp. LIG4]SCK22312.1 AraC-type DNA-binding protein [Vogesella sp. LIG4]